MEIYKSCYNIKEVVLPSCPDSIGIQAGLAPETEYEAIIEDKFGNRLTYGFTTDVEGIGSIVIDDPSIFNEHAGTFILQVFNDGCLYDLSICGIDYQMVYITFRKYYPQGEMEAPDAMIKCDCDA